MLDFGMSQSSDKKVFKEVWANLSELNTWTQVAGWAILCSTNYIPVMVFWGTKRLSPNEPLLPLFVGISVLGGVVGMPLLYPKRGSWFPGMIAGLLFGPGVFLAFGLLAGHVMNKLIFAGLVLLGGGPSFGLYVLLLYKKALQREQGRELEAPGQCSHPSP
jgi:hypothetical protein